MSTRAPDAVAPPPGHRRFPRVDSLRALAALAVLLTHTATFSGFSPTTAWGAIWHNLDVGVPVFFVVSGFLLYRPFVAAAAGLAPAIETLDYAWRRALRIVPAYWLALTVLAAWVHLHGVFTGDWWRYYLFLQIYSHRTLYGGIAPAWTLCVEVSFYVLLPLYAAALGRWLQGCSPLARRRIELRVLGALAGASLILRAIDLAGGQGLLANTVLENFDWFAGGMALAAVSATTQAGAPLPAPMRWARARPAFCWLLAGGIYLVLAATVHYPVVAHAGQLAERPLGGTVRHVGFALIAVVVALPAMFPDGGRSGIPGRLLDWRVLAWLGLISYGIYLWHSPLLGKLLEHGARTWLAGHVFIVLSSATAAAALTTAAASYYVVERPLLALKRLRPGQRRP